MKNVMKAKKEKAAKALKKNKEQGDNDNDGKKGLLNSFRSIKMIAISCNGGIGELCSGRSVLLSFPLNPPPEA